MLIEQGERVSFSSLVLFEWLRGPRRADELRVQEALFPSGEAAPFGPAGPVLPDATVTANEPDGQPWKFPGTV